MKPCLRLSVLRGWVAGIFLSTALVMAPTHDASARTLEQIKSLGAISVCANPEALPYSNDKENLPGFQIEIARLVARALSVQLNVDWIVPRRRATVVNCDMLLDRPNDPTIYEGRLLLSRPYQKSGVVLGLARGAGPVSDYQELKQGQKVGIMIGSIASVLLGKAHKTTSPYAFQSDMLEDLEKGELYGAAVSSPYMSYYIFSHPDSGLRLARAFDSVPDLSWEVSIAFRNSDQALVDAVNAALEKLAADGTIGRIYAKYGVEYRRP